MGNTQGLCCAPSLSVIVMSLCLLPYTCASTNILKKLLYAREYYVGDNGIMCLMCPAGTFVSSHCETDLTRSHCESCGPGTFSPSMDKARSCEDCKLCGLGQEKIKHCTTKSDAVCVCPDNMVEVLNMDNGTYCVLKTGILPKTNNLRTTAIVIPFLHCPDDQYRDDNGNCLPCPSTLQPHVYNVTFVDKPSVTNKVDVTDKDAQEVVWYKSVNGQKTDTSVMPQQASSTTVPPHPECPSGMYRDILKNNDCFSCSNCSNATHPCNGTHDTICASSQNANESDNSKQGLIIGITVAAVVIVAIVGILLLAVRYYINKQKGRGLCKDEKWYKVLYSAIINTNIEETAI